MVTKKGVSAIVSTALLIVVSVLSVIGFSSLYESYSSKTLADVESKSVVSNVVLEYLNSNLLYVKNPYERNVTYKEIRVDGVNCNIPLGNLSKGIKEIDLGTCMAGMTEGYKDVVIVTDSGVFTQVMKLELGGESVSIGNSTITFSPASTCAAEETRLFGIDAEINAHGEVGTSETYPISICLDHETREIGTDCNVGISESLFYLGNTTNSHVWVTNASAYVPYVDYYNWQEVCISLDSGTLDVVYNISNMATDGYSCLGSYLQDDVYGGMFGDCNTSSSYTKIWVLIG